MELSTQVKKYRTELKLSQEELAEKVYVTRQTISNWENGKSYPDIHSLLLLSSLFDVQLLRYNFHGTFHTAYFIGGAFVYVA